MQNRIHTHDGLEQPGFSVELQQGGLPLGLLAWRLPVLNHIELPNGVHVYDILDKTGLSDKSHHHVGLSDANPRQAEL